MFAVLIFLAAALVTVLSISNVNHDEKSPIKQVAETNSTALQQDDGDTSNETSTSTISLDFAVPEIDTIEWLTYRDSVLEIEFKYPNTWPEPVIRTNIPKNITWALDVGPLGKGFCEGSDCYVYHLSGKSGGDYELERQRIKNEGSTIFSDVLREDGVRVIDILLTEFVLSCKD